MYLEIFGPYKLSYKTNNSTRPSHPPSQLVPLERWKPLPSPLPLPGIPETGVHLEEPPQRHLEFLGPAV